MWDHPGHPIANNCDDDGRASVGGRGEPIPTQSDADNTSLTNADTDQQANNEAHLAEVRSENELVQLEPQDEVSVQHLTLSNPSEVEEETKDPEAPSTSSNPFGEEEEHENELALSPPDNIEEDQSHALCSSNGAENGDNDISPITPSAPQAEQSANQEEPSEDTEVLAVAQLLPSDSNRNRRLGRPTNSVTNPFADPNEEADYEDEYDESTPIPVTPQNNELTHDAVPTVASPTSSAGRPSSQRNPFVPADQRVIAPVTAVPAPDERVVVTPNMLPSLRLNKQASVPATQTTRAHAASSKPSSNPFDEPSASSASSTNPFAAPPTRGNVSTNASSNPFDEATASNASSSTSPPAVVPPLARGNTVANVRPVPVPVPPLNRSNTSGAVPVPRPVPRPTTSHNPFAEEGSRSTTVSSNPFAADASTGTQPPARPVRTNSLLLNAQGRPSLLTDNSVGSMSSGRPMATSSQPRSFASTGTSQGPPPPPPRRSAAVAALGAAPPRGIESSDERTSSGMLVANYRPARAAGSGIPPPPPQRSGIIGGIQPPASPLTTTTSGASPSVHDSNIASAPPRVRRSVLSTEAEALGTLAGGRGPAAGSSSPSTLHQDALKRYVLCTYLG